MKRINVILGCASAIVIASAAIIVGVVVWTNLTEYPALRAGGIVTIFGGLAVAALVAFFSAHAQRIRGPVTVAVCLALLLGVPAASMFAGRITYSQFGFTVYGLIPLPVLDIKVGTSRILGFRNKTHQITLAEIESFLSEDVAILIIGTGWNEVAQVELSLRSLSACRVEIHSTPQAFALYNRLSREGRKVVLIGHTTC
ncbi:MTH938/NDUFAF3 family protein [Candidatus Hydrogenedentota bacterium]